MQRCWPMESLLLRKVDLNTMLQELIKKYQIDNAVLGPDQLEELRDGLKTVHPDEIQSAKEGKAFIDLLRRFRETVERNNQLNGANYHQLLSSVLSVGEDGLYSNNLRFIFELIQNVDDCDFPNIGDCKLDMKFAFDESQITLKYNENGFQPFNVFAITGIAEAAKNISITKNEIGEKGIGFKSVFGVANKVLIRSGWFSFEMHKDHFTIPISKYVSDSYIIGTEMTLYLSPGKTKDIYKQLKKQYCRKDALFSKNPLLFLNKLTSMKMYFDGWRSMEYSVSRSKQPSTTADIIREDNVQLSVDLHDYDNGAEIHYSEKISCVRYTYNVKYSINAYCSRYKTMPTSDNADGKMMQFQAILPSLDDIGSVGNGALYSFLPTQLQFNVPIVCHAPFKLDASREFVDPQGENLWFQESSKFLSELLDFVYQDWSKVVRTDIVRYLPTNNNSLFRKNNGKELCLSMRGCFKGEHYSNLPLFYTVNQNFKRSSEVFSFNQDEFIISPDKVYSMKYYTKELFIPPNNVKISDFGIEIERQVLNKLFQYALAHPDITETALNYLDSVKFKYDEQLLPQNTNISLTISQVEQIMYHAEVIHMLQMYTLNCIKQNRRMNLSVVGGDEIALLSALKDDFDISETPKQVEKYINSCGGNCICIDIGESSYLPFDNAIVLSNQNTLSSFASFCYAIDQRDTFSIRIKLREASARLNTWVDESIGTSEEFIRELRNIRLHVRDSLGKQGYNNYIDLILKSGTDKTRFIQEILQNADDCEYPDDEIPRFIMRQSDSVITTKSNEIGFTRSNIRSITAIGESTKNRLLGGYSRKIGEKGIGFKTIFAIASEVKISSGDYHFALTDREPTIPKNIGQPTKMVSGTIMDIRLKDRNALPPLNEKSILELCLCLRKLKKLEISGSIVNIEDYESSRVITIGKKRYSFKRFVYTFKINDEEAIQQRSNGGKDVTSEQQIICYVPEKNEPSDFYLYSGFATKHKIKIPMVIDAPFSLTTSRERIDTNSTRWNGIIRHEMYCAILQVIESLKVEERARVLRFARFTPRRHGTATVYVNDTTDSDYLNEYSYLSLIKQTELLPTFDPSVYVAPIEKKASRFPEVINLLLRKGLFGHVNPYTAIDLADTEYESVLKALGQEVVAFNESYPIIEYYAESNIHDKEFRSKLYEYLLLIPSQYHFHVSKLRIIPVYGRDYNTIEYISWKEDSIFVKKNSEVSTSDYYILNENELNKSACEKIFGVYINEINFEWEKNRYNDRLRVFIKEQAAKIVYQHLLNDFNKGLFEYYDSQDTLIGLKEFIPLKNQLGEIANSDLFICNQPEGYFSAAFLEKIIIHRECASFALFLKYPNLQNIHYENIQYDAPLTADDVESLLDSYFANGEELLRGFFRDNLLSNELLVEYKIEYITLSPSREEEYNASFPDEKVNNILKVREHVRRLWQNPTQIVSVKEERTVQKGRAQNGVEFSLDRDDAREGALRTYEPEGLSKRCFCQICKKIKQNSYIEVNNIQKLPKYFFPQLRIALCLECSKRFKAIRENPNFYSQYLASIQTTDISSKGVIEIPIGSGETITFTGKHLAEVQEILRGGPVDKT